MPSLASEGMEHCNAPQQVHSVHASAACRVQESCGSVRLMATLQMTAGLQHFSKTSAVTASKH